MKTHAAMVWGCVAAAVAMGGLADFAGAEEPTWGEWQSLFNPSAAWSGHLQPAISAAVPSEALSRM